MVFFEGGTYLIDLRKELKKMSGRENYLKDKSFRFALRIVRLSQYLNDEKKEFVMSKQVLKSGTSIGANVRESQNAESRMDLIHKLSISQKEADETLYWLELLHPSAYLETPLFTSLYNEGNELLRLLKSILITTKSNLKK
jgi:four helix bundle protein